MKSKRLLAATLAATATLGVAASTATAATVSYSGGGSTVYYKALPGEINSPVIWDATSGPSCTPETCFGPTGPIPAPVYTPGRYGQYVEDLTAPLEGKAGCANETPHRVWCHNVRRPGLLLWGLGDGDDSFTDLSTLGHPLDLTTGGGSDTVNHVVPATFNGAVSIDSGGGADTITTSGGDETLTTGSGNDVVKISDFAALSLVTGDGKDNVTLTSPRATFVGTRTVDLGAGTDTINAADGASESLTCGADVDTVSADPLDVLAADCP